MVWADYVIIAIVVFSAVVGMVRGFVREVFSLASWIGAFVVAVLFAAAASGLLTRYLHGEQLRLVLAFAGLFALTLLVGIVLGHIAGTLVERAKLSTVDRGMGLIFGFARGYIAVAALVVAASFTNLPQAPWWQHSRLLPYSRPLAVWISEHLPNSRLGRV